ncbi:60S ribosomal protein L27-3 [Bienertia sinuspersici]
MVKFLKSGKPVIMLQGRYAIRKAVIVHNFDDGTRDHKYGHCLVAGINKYPKKVIRKDSAKKQAKKSRVKCFIKLVNYNHIMPTLYTLDVDLKNVISVDVLQSKKKILDVLFKLSYWFELHLLVSRVVFFLSNV